MNTRIIYEDHSVNTSCILHSLFAGGHGGQVAAYMQHLNTNENDNRNPV